MLTILIGKAGLDINMEVNGSKEESGTRSNKLEPDLHFEPKLLYCFQANNLK